jgi:hypothetical protein
MADSLTTITQLLRLADNNVGDVILSDLLMKAPLLERMQATLANASQGAQHKYLKHVTAPSVGFRPVNTGLDYSTSDQALVTVDLKNLSANIRFDKQVYNNMPDKDMFMAEQGRLSFVEAFKMAEKQILYGTGALGAADGFTGLLQAATVATIAGGAVFNAGGSAARTSVLLVKFGASDIELIVGNDGVLEIGDDFEQLIPDATGKLFPAICRNQEGMLSVKAGAKYSMVRIANVGTGATLTDALIYDAMELFPEDQPDLIIMNKRSVGQLRKSRTATTTKGTPAPYPTEVEGIPILVTPNLSNAEAAVA